MKYKLLLVILTTACLIIFTGNASGATLASPPPGTTLSDANVTFSWPNDGSQQYWIYVGNRYGENDIASINTGRALSATVYGLPTDARTLYVRLWYLVNYYWYYSDYTYRAASSGGGSSGKAVILDPVPGSTLTSSSARFTLSAVNGAYAYFLYLGRAPGGSDIASLGGGLATQLYVTGIPTDGSRVYARIWTLGASGWLYNDVSYATQAAGVPATVYHPSSGSTLTGGSATFAWSGGQRATGYCLGIGSAPGGTDLYSRCVGLDTSATVNSLPLDGRRVYVRLTTQFSGSSQWRDVTYTAASQSTAFRLSVFPLPTLTHASAQINSVFDHAAVTQYCADGRVVAYNGEQGSKAYGSSAVGNITGCGVLSGFRNSNGTNFTLNGQYTGAGTPSYLFYDGHPGYDYRTTGLCPAGRVSDLCPVGRLGRVIVRAAAAGKVVALVTSYGRVQLSHPGGYETWYMHLESFKVTVGQQVQAGDVLGIAGDRGSTGSPHLHFEVRNNNVPVDPYGWTGAGTDPYTAAKNVPLW